MSSDTVLFDLKDHVAVITLNRPAQRNAINQEMSRTLMDYLRRVREDGDIRAAIITGYVSAINGLYNQQLLADLASRRGLPMTSLLPVQVNLSVWYNPTLESKNAVVPGLLVLILMLFPALLGSLLVVREKESGTIFNLYASPTGRLDIIIGKLLPQPFV